MKRVFALIFLFCSILFVATGAMAQSTDLEDLTLDPETYWNGSDASEGFVSNGVFFNNAYNSAWMSWDGFAYSNITDTTADGYAAQYNAIPGSGAGGSEIYAVGYVSAIAAAPPTIILSSAQVIDGAYFTNNNYAFYSMKNGDDFSKKFTASDWFKLTITGIDAQGEKTGTVEFKLANGIRIVDSWTWVDLSSLGTVKKLTFDLSSTDNGDYGMNTPAYFCIDNVNINDGDDSTCFIQSIMRH